MWYTFAYNKVSGFGGGILPPLPKTTEKKLNPWETEELKAEIDAKNQFPPPIEQQTIQTKLEHLHTNGQNYVPPSHLKGINSPAAIEDQYIETQNIVSDAGNAGQGYEPNYM